MNKCRVCGKEYIGNECPIDKFPVVVAMEETPGLAAAVANYRKNFFQKIQVGIISYSWKDSDGYLTLDQEHGHRVGNCNELMERVVWLNQQFARIPDVDSLELRIFVDREKNRTEKTAKVPNLKKPYLQEIGLSINEDLQVVLHLRNEAGEYSKSGPIELF